MHEFEDVDGNEIELDEDTTYRVIETFVMKDDMTDSIVFTHRVEVLSSTGR